MLSGLGSGRAGRGRIAGGKRILASCLQKGSLRPVLIEAVGHSSEDSAMPGRERVLRLEVGPARSGCDIPAEVSELLVDALESHGVGLCMCVCREGSLRKAVGNLAI
jgi:hypothetical protein